jgi:hypothetical protein
VECLVERPSRSRIDYVITARIAHQIMHIAAALLVPALLQADDLRGVPGGGAAQHEA